MVLFEYHVRNLTAPTKVEQTISTNNKYLVAIKSKWDFQHVHNKW